MNIKTLSLPRFLGLLKRQSDPKPERVERLHHQEGSSGIGPHDPQKASASERKDLPAADILAEMTCAACGRSTAGLTVFIP